MAESFRSILCPVYFDETSPVALQYAQHFARQSGGKVSLFHAVPTDEFHLLRSIYRPEEGGGADPKWADKVAQEKLQGLAQEYLGDTSFEIVTRLSEEPASGILEAAKENGADLIVMVTHGRAGLAHMVWGSVAEKVVRESTHPVFSARRDEPLSSIHPFQKILVPVDITDRAETALTTARQLAEQYDGMVYPLHIVPTEESELLLRDVYRESPTAKANLVYAEKVARQKLEGVAIQYLSGVQYEPVLHVSNDPARTILEMEQSIGADVLIMATHGFTGMFHLLLRSLTEKMMRESNCPVLSIHQE